VTGKTLVLFSSSKDRKLASETQTYLTSIGADVLPVGAADEAVKVLRTRRDVDAAIVVGDAAYLSSSLLGWIRMFRPNFPCCVMGTEKGHLAACAAANGHLLMTRETPFHLVRLAGLLRSQLNH
jgi:hypothetical protein